jgi:methyl-accepting chemotaxis protein
MRRSNTSLPGAQVEPLRVDKRGTPVRAFAQTDPKPPPSMKLQQLTIGQRVALGFAFLLLLGAGLGGFAAWRMAHAASGADLLAHAVAPQAEVTSNLAQFSALLQRNARTYGLTGDENYLKLVRSDLTKLETGLDAARQLSSEQPSLTALAEGVKEAEKALADYVAQIDLTESLFGEFAGIRGQLDTAALQFTDSLNRYVKSQEVALTAETKGGATSDQLLERQSKLSLANEVLELGNEVRVSAQRAQALRDVSIIEGALANFEKMESLRLKALATTRVEADQKKLAEVAAAAAGYREGVLALTKNFAGLAAAGKARTQAADAFDAVVGGVLERSIQRTLDYANASSTGLATASRGVLWGLVGMAALGAAAAVLIIRGVNRALNLTADSLNQGSLQVASASGQVSSASQALAEGSSEQAASLEEISSSLEELSSMTKRNADNAQSGKAASQHARAAAESGASEMERMQAAMSAIQQSSQDISKIIKTIDEIAFQTNILALNAAVEAARAGEAGAGFAVVADEVRSLAQRSAVAAKETADKIADATQKSAQGVELSVRVASGLQEILEKTREVDRLVAEVATASQEQSEGITQINTAVSQMDKVTQANAAGAEETASAAEELNAQSAELQQAASQLAALVGASRAHSAPAQTKTPHPESAHLSFVPPAPASPAPEGEGERKRSTAARATAPAPTTATTHSEPVPHAIHTPKLTGKREARTETLSFRD